ncbi:uncharacterized protein DMAD_13179 [Drosophila madeirensis]
MVAAVIPLGFFILISVIIVSISIMIAEVIVVMVRLIPVPMISEILWGRLLSTSAALAADGSIGIVVVEGKVHVVLLPEDAAPLQLDEGQQDQCE